MKKIKESGRQTFGQRLRSLRIQKEMSQIELAHKAKLHNTHISRFEKDAIKPGADTLMRLADALDVTADYLMGGPTDEAAQDRLSDVELLRQFQEVEKFPEGDKTYIKRLLKDVITSRKVTEMAAL